MTEPTDSPVSPRAAHPGDLIRAAREARGWTLSHLSMLLKLPERRLQAFEEGRWEDVGDRTFVRALAQSLSRHLSIDPAPLLQSLPQAAEAVMLREASASRTGAAAVELPDRTSSARRSGVRMPSSGGGVSTWRRPSVLVGALILLAAAALAFAPSSWWESAAPATTEVVLPLPPALPSSSAIPGMADPGAASQATPSPSASGAAPAAADSTPAAPAVTPAVRPSSTVSPVGSPAASPPASSSASGAIAPSSLAAPLRDTTTAPSGPWGAGSTAVAPVKVTPRASQVPRSADEPALRLSVSQTSWIQVTDAQGQVLVSRLIPAGERVELVGARPLSLRVGNVAGVQAQWRGQDIDLSAYQRSNVAQVELP